MSSIRNVKKRLEIRISEASVLLDPRGSQPTLNYEKNSIPH